MSLLISKSLSRQMHKKLLKAHRPPSLKQTFWVKIRTSPGTGSSQAVLHINWRWRNLPNAHLSPVLRTWSIAKRTSSAWMLSSCRSRLRTRSRLPRSRNNSQNYWASKISTLRKRSKWSRIKSWALSSWRSVKSGFKTWRKCLWDTKKRSSKSCPEATSAKREWPRFDSSSFSRIRLSKTN